ncbi:hypothetical protein KC330_g7639 [Hortaea werneckii]|nr:hypothetical protein KC330_g7639 [Hortaea werneckii]
MSYVPAFERRYKSIGNVLGAITDYASHNTPIEEGKSHLSKAGNATTGNAAAIANEVSVLNMALAHASEKSRAEDVSHLAEELNGWMKHQVGIGERTALAALRQENVGQAKVVEQELLQLREKVLKKDERIRELEAGVTSQEDTTLQLCNDNRAQKVTLEKNGKTIQSLQAQLEQQKQASVTEVTKLKSQFEQTRNELMAQLKASKDRASDLERSLDTERARADDFETQKETNSNQALRLYHSLNAAKDHGRLEEKEREADRLLASKEKAWDEAENTIGVANEAFKANAAIDVSKNLREQGEQRLKEAESTIQMMSKLCSPTEIEQTADEDIESVLQRMKSVLDSNDTTVEEMD